MNVKFRIVGLTRDRRTHEDICRAAACHQEALDQALELEWRRRVVRNIQRRQARRVDRLLQEQRS